MTTSPSSNRGSTKENSSTLAQRLALDKFRVSFPVLDVNEHRLDMKMRLSGAERLYFGSQRVPLSTSPHAPSLTVTQAGRNGTWATLTCNPSRLVDPEGWGLATVAKGAEAIRECWESIAGLVTPARPLAKCNVREVHLAVDIERVLTPHRYLTVLAPIASHAPNRMKAQTVINDGVVESLWVSNKTGGRVSLYDKHIETGGAAPPGVMRAEVQAKRWAKQNGLEHVEDLTPSKCAIVFKRYWKESRLGTPVTSREDIYERLLRRLPAGSRLLTAVGVAYCLAEGRETGLSGKTESQYLALLAEVGVSPLAMQVRDDSIPFVGRLDPLSGEEILAPVSGR